MTYEEKYKELVSFIKWYEKTYLKRVDLTLSNELQLIKQGQLKATTQIISKINEIDKK